jgi:hypothetical protein
VGWVAEAEVGVGEGDTVLPEVEGSAGEHPIFPSCVHLTLL